MAQVPTTVLKQATGGDASVSQALSFRTPQPGEGTGAAGETLSKEEVAKRSALIKEGLDRTKGVKDPNAVTADEIYQRQGLPGTPSQRRQLAINLQQSQAQGQALETQFNQRANAPINNQGLITNAAQGIAGVQNFFGFSDAAEKTRLAGQEINDRLKGEVFGTLFTAGAKLPFVGKAVRASTPEGAVREHLGTLKTTVNDALTAYQTGVGNFADVTAALESYQDQVNELRIISYIYNNSKYATVSEEALKVEQDLVLYQNFLNSQVRALNMAAQERARAGAGA